MARISPEERERLRQAVTTHEYLRRIVRALEGHHRLVFHGAAIDAAKIRGSAEDILVADIVMRHRGNFDGVYFALRAAEDAGRTWDQAVVEYAARIHAYYTTPLGLLIRRDLFGNDAHFISPDAQRFLSAVSAAPRPSVPPA
jgi:hypothetical protein